MKPISLGNMQKTHSCIGLITEEEEMIDNHIMSMVEEVEESLARLPSRLWRYTKIVIDDNFPLSYRAVIVRRTKDWALVNLYRTDMNKPGYSVTLPYDVDKDKLLQGFLDGSNLSIADKPQDVITRGMSGKELYTKERQKLK